MTRYGLNAEELFIIELLLLANSELRHSEYLCKYLEASKCDLRSILVSLQNKNVILKSYKVPDKGSTFDPETVPFSKNFLTGHMKCSNELGYEFWRTYPSICVINGVEAPLKNFAKKFNSEDEFFFAYGKSIGWSSVRNVGIHVPHHAVAFVVGAPKGIPYLLVGDGRVPLDDVVQSHFQ